ncbi:MAG TPA: ATP-binding cassette domain-containing protein [Thermoanaerobaculia bacterium]|nr:ATP-binding cassette domain-containing protein [Thermoanaerobaculia bacterium]
MILNLAHIRRTFGATVALDDVSLSAGPGEIIGIIGENGAGKTTLMRIIAGEIVPDAGSVAVDGTVGFVHQHFMLVSEFTIAENLALAAGSMHPPVSFERPRRLVRELSVGERSKLELAKAIAGRPRVLILDEPTSVLTPVEAEDLFQTMRLLADSGTCVLLISHKIREVLGVATRTVVMRRGRIVAENLSAEAMARAMVDVPVEPGRSRSNRTASGREADESRLYRPGQIAAIIGVAGNGQVELATRLRDTLARASAAHIPEDRTRDGFVAEMSIAENIALLAGVRGARARAARLIETYGIRASGPEQRAGSLSGGNQQKLLLARELDRNPKIIIAAEPTRGLDFESTRFVHQQLRAAAERGAAIVLITSDLDEAFALADEIRVIYRGRLSEPLTPAEASERAGRLMAGLE